MADPLGGSYYVESLTNKIEAETLKLLDEIDSIGGMWECLKTGWLLSQFDKTTLSIQKEIDDGTRIIVGVNAYAGPNGPISEAIKKTAYPVPPAEERQAAVIKVKKLREQRDPQNLVDALTSRRQYR